MFNGACYEITRDTHLNMMASRSACKTRGGELASLHSRDEAEFIYQMSNRIVEVIVKNLWIGLFKKGKNMTLA